MEPAVKETGPVAAKPGPPSDDQSSAAAAAAAAAAADFLMEEQKYDDSKTDIETALREIQAMLKIELEHWFRTDNSATSELIGRYDTAIELLITFVRERDVNAFCLVFTKFNITIQGIRGCFYNSGPNVKARRILQQAAIREQAKTMKIGEQEALQFFSGQRDEAAKGVEEDPLSMFK